MEIEAKYRVTGALRPAALEAVDLDPYSLVAGGERALRDELLDTAGRTLAAHGYALRLRRDGSRLLATLKRDRAPARGAVHRREEIEVEADPAAIARGVWPSVIWDAIGPVVGGQPLVPLFRVENRRRTWDVRRDDALVAELALDEGSIHIHDRVEPFRELEVELKGAGGEADLAVITRRLAARLPLEPEPRSRFERGLALLAETAETSHLE